MVKLIWVRNNISTQIMQFNINKFKNWFYEKIWQQFNFSLTIQLNDFNKLSLLQFSSLKVNRYCFLTEFLETQVIIYKGKQYNTSFKVVSRTLYINRWYWFLVSPPHCALLIKGTKHVIWDIINFLLARYCMHNITLISVSLNGPLSLTSSN